LLWLAAVACLWLNLLDDPPLHSGAYLQDVGTDGATIAKITAAPTRLRCVVTDEAGDVVQTVEDVRDRRRHALRVGGLRADSTYSYELTAGSEDVERGRIRTAPDRDDVPVRFAFLGDSGDQPWWVWLQRTPALHLPARWDWFPTSSEVTRIGAAVAAYAPDFTLHLGDVVYPKGMHAHYRSGFFRPFAELIRNAPLYAVLGNHDVMNCAGQQLLANLHAPVSSVTGDHRCFSFARGAVRVIGLDCNTWLTGDRCQPGHPSVEFLVAELAKCTEPWIVVASHFPMRSASRQRDSGELLLSLLPVIDEAQVSLYLSGHDHCYQRFRPETEGGPPLVVSGGGGKSLYEVRPHARAVVLESAYHWCSAEARGARLTVTAHALGTGVLDRFELSLPSGVALERLRRRLPERAARIDALGR
jgi:hypothetical protein